MTERTRIQELLYQKEFKKVEQILYSIQVLDADLLVLMILIQIFYREEKEKIRDTVFSISLEIDTLVKHFVKLKLLLRRLDFDLPVEFQEEVYSYCIEHGVSRCLLAYILINNIFNQKKVCKQIIAMFPEQAAYFREIYQYLEGKENG